MDHSYMTAVVGHPPDLPCAIMAGFLLEFVTTQLLLVTFIATNAFVMVVKERRIHTGKYDWRLLVGCFGTPAILCIVAYILEILGPSGAWCFFNARKKLGVIASNIVAATMVLIFMYNTLSYIGIWYKIRKVSQSSTTTSTNQKKYQKSAKTMMFFVAAFIGQWWAFIIFSLWSFFSDPHIAITVAAVIFSNMGGVFNFLSYTYVRKRQRSVESSGNESVTGTTMK